LPASGADGTTGTTVFELVDVSLLVVEVDVVVEVGDDVSVDASAVAYFAAAAYAAANC